MPYSNSGPIPIAFQKNQSAVGPTKSLEGRRYGMEGTEETEEIPKLRVGPSDVCCNI